MKALLLSGFLSLCSCSIFAQQWTKPEELQLPRWQYGVDISSPLLLQFDHYANWDRAFLLEGLLQYRLGGGTFWPQLYSGVFTGKNAFERGLLKQNGFYIKPGMAFQLDKWDRAQPFLELNGLISWGNLRGHVEQLDPVFGDALLNVQQQVAGGGLEIGAGAFIASYKGYRLRFSGVAFGTIDTGPAIRYLPGAGRLMGDFLYLSGALRLHLMRGQ